MPPFDQTDLLDQLLRAIRGETGVPFVNAVLEGPTEDEPTELHVFAALYPDPPLYRLLCSEEEMPHVDVRAYRQRVLSLKVPDRVARRQREIARTICQASSEAVEVIWQLVETRTRAEGVPLAVVAFGTNLRRQRPVVGIFHAPYLPSIAYLERLQARIRDAEKNSPR